MPIFIRGSIIGVVQMVNKHQGFFTKNDEAAFEMFAIYCGLALHHATLYDQIRKSEQKYKVALEVLCYHNTCSEEEYVNVEKDGIPEDLLGVDDYYFNPFQLEDYQKVRYSMFMFTDLFGLNMFDPSSLMKFTLTVKKNYRRVPYHNWTHGFSVANSMYSIIKRTQTIFSLPEVSNEIDFKKIKISFCVLSIKLSCLFECFQLGKHLTRKKVLINYRLEISKR